MANYSRFKVNVSVGRRTPTMVGGKGGKKEVAFPGQARAIDQFKKVEKEYARWVQHLRGNMGVILEDSLQIVFAVSQELVPHKTGELKRSGYVTRANSGKKMFAEIGYAKGGSPDYAVIVHEDLMKFHEPPTQAKFLEDAIEREAENVQEFIISATKDMAGF